MAWLGLDWQIMEGVGGLATALAVVAALVFGVMQVRQFNRARQETAAMELIRAAHDKDFEHSWPIVMQFPDGMTREELRRRGPEAERAAMAVQYHFETMGVLVFHRIVPLHMFDYASGGVCRACWRKLKNYVEVERDGDRFVSFAEWFQWLAEQLEKHPAPGKLEGAHNAFREWQP